MKEETSRACRAVGALIVDGKRVGWLRCHLPAGHHEARQWPRASGEIYTAHNGTPHNATLEWQDDAVQLDDWPEAYDADETFDIEVPASRARHAVETVDDLDAGPQELAGTGRLERAGSLATIATSTCRARRFQDGALCGLGRGHGGDHWPTEPLVEPPAPVAASVIGTCLELRPGDNAPCLLPNAHDGLHAWPVKLYGG